jgi:hypothetical protein
MRFGKFEFSYRFLPSKTHLRIMTPGYESWSKDELIARLRKLEASNPLTNVWQTIPIFIPPEAQDRYQILLFGLAV